MENSGQDDALNILKKSGERFPAHSGVSTRIISRQNIHRLGQVVFQIGNFNNKAAIHRGRLYDLPGCFFAMVIRQASEKDAIAEKIAS